MKKWFWALAVLLILGLAAIYYYIPGTLLISEAVSANVTPEGAYRSLSDSSNWNKWWPHDAPGNDPRADNAHLPLRYNNDSYIITKRLHNWYEIQVGNNGITVTSNLYLFPMPNKTTMAKWECSISPGNNPIKRVVQYRQALAIKKNMHVILGSLQHYLSRQENIYRLTLLETGTPDTLLIATKSLSANYPGTDIIYSMIDRLTAYCRMSDARVTGSPMLNVTKLYPANYQVMVALPVNKALSGNGVIFPRKMVPGKFITTTVTGGPHTIDEAFKQVHFFFQDYQRTSMAIPFAYLVTDRRQETDTSKWITKIYAPVY
jgi:hypothetical protein